MKYEVRSRLLCYPIASAGEVPVHPNRNLAVKAGKRKVISSENTSEELLRLAVERLSEIDLVASYIRKPLMMCVVECAKR